MRWKPRCLPISLSMGAISKENVVVSDSFWDSPAADSEVGLRSPGETI